MLLNLDAAVTEDKRLGGVLFDRWAARMGDHGITDGQARAHFAPWSQEDRYFPLDAELHALCEARLRGDRVLLATRTVRHHVRAPRPLTPSGRTADERGRVGAARQRL